MIIYFDGGCRPNPGTMCHAYVSSEGDSEFFFGGMGTNNMAEWLALLKAVEYAVAKDPDQTDDFIFAGDSTLVVKGAAGEWKVKVPEFRQIKSKIGKLLAGRTVEFRYVPRDKNLAGIFIEHKYAESAAIARNT